MKRAGLILCLLSCTVSLGYGQQDSVRSQVQDDLEEALESFDTEDPNLNTELLTQILLDLAADPININNAGTADLLQVPGMDLKLARAIIQYRQEVKPFESIQELVEVKGIGSATFEKMAPYITIGAGLALSKRLYTDYNYWTHDGTFVAFSRFQRKLQQQEGFRRPDSTGGYLGGPTKYYQRFQYESDHISLNVTQQKDAGEPFTGTTGFDYTSWHLAFEDNGKLQQLVVGDYSLSFGQGLVLWPGRTFGKGRAVIGSTSRNSRGIRPYTSSQESNALRGVAATYGGRLQLSAFYSYRSQSASVVDSNTTRLPQTDGYHRTQNERSQRRNLNQRLYGAHLRMELPIGFIGATGYRTVFDRYIYAGDRISDRYDFSGRATSVLGVDYTLLVGPAIVFGEAARSQNGAIGFITGVESSIGPQTGLTVAYRNYAKDFQSILGNGFGESSGEPQNERGFYIGLRHQLNEYVTLSAYFDQYQFPAPRFGVHQPTQGYDWLGVAEVQINDAIQFYVQLRSEVEEDEYEIQDSFGRTQRLLGEALRTSLRLQFQYQVNTKIRLRTRGEVVRSRQAGAAMEYGFLMYQDVRFTPNEKLTLDARITVFDTDSYDTRLYQFENDLLYVMSNQMLYKQGQRLYVVVNYEPFHFLEIWAKFGITIYANTQRISSGLNEIRGNKQSEMGLQVRLKL